jgi:hypothetical protein
MSILRSSDASRTTFHRAVWDDKFSERGIEELLPKRTETVKRTCRAVCRAART